MKRRKMSIDEYCEREFTDGSAPSRRTVVNWINKGVIEGVCLGGKYWVYEAITEADLIVEKVLRAS